MPNSLTVYYLLTSRQITVILATVSSCTYFYV